MLKIAAAGSTALCAGILCMTPYSVRLTPDGSVSLSVDSAAAVIGRPLTPMSIAGVHRRAYRRGHYGAYYHPYRHYGTYYSGYRPGYSAYRYAYGTYQSYSAYGGYGIWNSPWYNTYRPYPQFGYYRY
jgi:hypothetical protein